jgi:osmoprotectant transport system substrate-binding protein
MKWTNKYLRAGAATLVMAGALGTYAASSTASTPHKLPGKGKPTFVLGDKNFAEEYILGDLYQQALEDKGYTVKLKANLGSTEIAYKALKSGQIGGYPEYDGTLLANAANNTKLFSSSQATVTAARAFATKQGLILTRVTPFTDADAIVVTKSFANKNHLASIAGLKRLGKKVVLGGAPELAPAPPTGWSA